MEDILASIRRILSEDEQPGAGYAAGDPPASGATSGGPVSASAGSGVLVLDESMLVLEEPMLQADAAANPPDSAADDDMDTLIASMSAQPEELRTEPDPLPPPAIEPAPPTRPAVDNDRLMAPETEAATTSAVSSLLRTLEAGREQAGLLPVYRGGPTLEDMVRDEMRPLLKAWLDSNLPPLVERLVRTEIERLVGRPA